MNGILRWPPSSHTRPKMLQRSLNVYEISGGRYSSRRLLIGTRSGGLRTLASQPYGLTRLSLRQTSRVLLGTTMAKLVVSLHLECSSGIAHSDVVSSFPIEGEGYATFKLPPLDVLMVWHAHMLNPRIYLEDSIRYTNHKLWRTSFPWEAVYASINNETFEYIPEDTTTLKQSTGEEWDSLPGKDLKEIRCPKCIRVHNVPWTQPPRISGSAALEAYLTGDTGFAGSAFQHNCTFCDLTITHEKLRVGKFCDDGEALMRLYRPLSGTVLNIWGEPAGTGTTVLIKVDLTEVIQAPPPARNSAHTTPSSPTASSKHAQTCAPSISARKCTT
jgi:hypothetical protein